MEAILEVNQLTRSFGGVVAISRLSFALEKGVVLGIIGPNGAGKTTLFNLISGFLKPDSGTIRFQKKELTRLKPYKIVNLGIARTFQIVKPFKELTVLQNVLIPCFSDRVLANDPGQILPLSRDKLSPTDRAMALLGEVGLADKKDQLAKELSHGELRLLDIARALTTKPELLLLDEPFSGLSQQESQGLLRILRNLIEKGQTTVLIEHKLRELIQLAQRILVLNFGEKLAEGTPGEILRDEKVIRAYLGHGWN